ncbi:MAG: extracellular solute-binding protein [Pleurocapsa minor GSE-CHR-MK-17-07R]|jgi:maltose/maltodextrin transport system substrate-binding protein/arabinogalactan oligomer/maltooligosaccharide transport system substrate-binding protein|nr:extracellular solute-binding protein [Pleurocapsa minor GSE-CHR-MK 17-07R]
MKRLFSLMVAGGAALLLTMPVLAQDRPDLLLWADSTRAPALQELLAQFSEDYGVVAQVQEIGMGEIRSNLTVAGPAGEGPDIVIGAHDWLGEYLQNGAIVPIDLGSKAADFSPSALDLFTVGGQLYGMPYAVENLAFFRNTDLVPEAPETWDEVFAITQELVDSGAAPRGWVVSSNASYDFQPVMSAFGGYVFGRNDDGSYNPQDIGIGNAGAVAAGEYIDQYVQAGYITPDIDNDVAVTLFGNREAAMMMTGPWFLNRVRESGVPFAISAPPAGPAGPSMPFIGGQGFMISAFSQNQLLAQAFLTEFMATTDAMLAMYNIDPRPPAFLPAVAAIEDQDMVAFQQAGANGIPQPSIPEMASVWGAWGNALQFIINGELTPEEAYTQAQAQVVELIGVLDAAPTSVGLVGTVQMFFGCPADWAPECPNTFMVADGDTSFSLSTAAIPAGDYEIKIALDGTWDRNFGMGGAAGGDNIPLAVAADGTLLVFSFSTTDNVLTASEGSAALVGTVQAALGCPGDWQPECAASELASNGDGTFSLSTTALTAGDYEVKVALNDGWGINYGADGVRNGDNIAFSVPSDGAAVDFVFDGTTNVLTVNVAG